MFTSVFNDVLGPVMRGPSSSHTAGSYHIARTVRDLLGAGPLDVDITFDANGSYARTYLQQGADQAFATGLMGRKLIDPVFGNALASAAERGIAVRFQVDELPQADHPNYAVIHARGSGGSELTVAAKSVGGGTFLVTQVDGHPVRLDGKSHVLLVECDLGSAAEVRDTIAVAYPTARFEVAETATGTAFLTVSSPDAVPAGLVEKLREGRETVRVRCARPVYYVKRGDPPFTSAEGMVAYAERNGRTLGEAVLRYEMALLGLSEDEAVAEVLYRYEVMKQSVLDGFVDEKVGMRLLEPTAASVRHSVENDRVAIGGIHARAAAAAMAAMHTCNSRGVVCAAPTGGAAGTLPGALTALDEAFDIDRRRMALMLFAAGGIGLILAIRGTFAAEVAGCQVEIGAAGAMASAAVVEFAGGPAEQGCDAGAISFQNTMGSVCDLVQGMCELPCHTRNAVAASSAFTNADLILGGYVNPIPLDETIDAVYSSGKLLPGELRCTSLGGLALSPSAQRLVPRSHQPET